jgi:hypothetical protein
MDIIIIISSSSSSSICVCVDFTQHMLPEYEKWKAYARLFNMCSSY